MRQQFNVQILGEVFSDPHLAGNQINQREQLLREALEWLGKSNAVMGGHFRFGEGRNEMHGRIYVNPRRLFSVPYAGRWVSSGLLKAIPSSILNQVEVVAGPATCGIIVARDLADAITTARPLKPKEDDDTPCEEVHALFLDKNWDDVYGVHPSDRLLLRDSEQKNRPRRVLLVDDVRNRGLTFDSCVRVITKAGGQVIATAEVIDRGQEVLPTSIKNFYLGRLKPQRLFKPSECPLCRANIEITTF